ncbi:MAG: hypothetical protein H6816_16400 [Phycisphaerales bacterium]|nr:hypothetical protein [Phycisphaerales bacterium]
MTKKTAAAATDTAPIDDLLPASMFNTQPMVPTVDDQFWFWVGVTADSPIPNTTCGGVAFSRKTELVRRDPSKRGNTARFPKAGAILKLTRKQVLCIAEHAARRVVRCAQLPAEQNAVSDLGRRIATVLRIPTEAEDQARQKNGWGGGRFHPSQGDVPLGRYLYCQYLDEVRPRLRPVGTALPPSLAEVGLRLPPADARPVPASETTDTSQELIA